MPEVCGEPHPEREGLACDRIEHQGSGFHRNAATGLVWEALPLPDLRRRGRGGLADIASRTRSSARTRPRSQ